MLVYAFLYNCFLLASSQSLNSFSDSFRFIAPLPVVEDEVPSWLTDLYTAHFRVTAPVSISNPSPSSSSVKFAHQLPATLGEFQ